MIYDHYRERMDDLFLHYKMHLLIALRDAKLDDLKDFEDEKLRKHLSVFNVFEVMNVDRKETLHSRIVGWLLNPFGNHGLSDSFMKAFLLHVISKSSDSAITEEDIADISADDVKIALEERLHPEGMKKIRRLDVSLSTRKIYVALENKIDSDEGEGQTIDEANYVRKKDSEKRKKLCIFLSPERDLEGNKNVPPKSEDFIRVTYKELKSILDRVVGQRGLGNSNIDSFLHQISENIDRNIEISETPPLEGIIREYLKCNVLFIKMKVWLRTIGLNCTVPPKATDYLFSFNWKEGVLPDGMDTSIRRLMNVITTRFRRKTETRSLVPDEIWLGFQAKESGCADICRRLARVHGISETNIEYIGKNSFHYVVRHDGDLSVRALQFILDVYREFSHKV